MDARDRKRIYKQAIEKWGVPSQMGMLMEECAELIQSTNKVLRKEDSHSLNRMAEEMADVEIMIEQLELGVDWLLLRERKEAYKKQKLERLRIMLAEHVHEPEGEPSDNPPVVRS